MPRRIITDNSKVNIASLERIKDLEKQLAESQERVKALEGVIESEITRLSDMQRSESDYLTRINALEWVLDKLLTPTTPDTKEV